MSLLLIWLIRLISLFLKKEMRGGREELKKLITNLCLTNYFLSIFECKWILILTWILTWPKKITASAVEQLVGSFQIKRRSGRRSS